MAEDKVITESRKRLAEWLAKIEILKDQIEKLKKLSSISMIPIFTFLLESQLVEFELKSLLTGLDLHARRKNSSGILKVSLRKSKDLKDLTLGRLKKELNRYEGLGGKKLIPELQDLIEKRNELAHKLFEPGKSLGQVLNEAKSGSKIPGRVLNSIKELNDKIFEDLKTD